MKVLLVKDSTGVESIEFIGEIQHDYSQGKDLIVLPELRKHESYLYQYKVTVIVEIIKGQ